MKEYKKDFYRGNLKVYESVDDPRYWRIGFRGCMLDAKFEKQDLNDLQVMLCEVLETPTVNEECCADCREINTLGPDARLHCGFLCRCHQTTKPKEEKLTRLDSIDNQVISEVFKVPKSPTSNYTPDLQEDTVRQLVVCCSCLSPYGLKKIPPSCECWCHHGKPVKKLCYCGHPEKKHESYYYPPFSRGTRCIHCSCKEFALDEVSNKN